LHCRSPKISSQSIESNVRAESAPYDNLSRNIGTMAAHQFPRHLRAVLIRALPLKRVQ
jgi:hypothetical protein